MAHNKVTCFYSIMIEKYNVKNLAMFLLNKGVKFRRESAFMKIFAKEGMSQKELQEMVLPFKKPNKEVSAKTKIYIYTCEECKGYALCDVQRPGLCPAFQHKNDRRKR